MLPISRIRRWQLAGLHRANGLDSSLSRVFIAAPPNRRPFSESRRCGSKIGRAPIAVPPGVEITLLEPRSTGRNRAGARVDVSMAKVHVKGPLGETFMDIPPYLKVSRDGDMGPVSLSVQDASVRHQRAMWGTLRADLNNHITGVSEGHIAILRLVGVGYRATIEPTAKTKEPAYPGQQFVNLKLGYSHPIELGIPKGVKASTPQPTRILLEGVDKHVVKQFAAHIRAWRVPEPYKGKGIFVDDETIKLKNKKIK
ncbi:uncharacterized protein PV09_04622 [Verruconis gallopava]|uniref:Large ribosomal subunit protein uL6 alpha-beta domain-containing protein n=1 Tax=Verruconis gallopava TaxID=253628 RepID=A0A0D1XP28_9PEZI|nr:uncharacterized protein PV09_04622 [Verruconis gallopava]KIW04331.1 hypothetical protein PV09_04622 [Verruconis gallopava]